jgi:hypothetical protein
LIHRSARAISRHAQTRRTGGGADRWPCALVAEQHKALSLLGKSSYQEVVEQDLRVKLAEAEIELAALRAAVHGGTTTE